MSLARFAGVALLAGAVAGGTATACSLCSGMAGRSSLRQEALQARYIYFGTMSNPRLNAGSGPGTANAGATDFTVSQVIKADSAARRAQKQFVVPRYVPVDPKAPPQYLLFCDEQNGQLDPYRGTPVQSPALVEYLRGAMAIDAKDTPKILAFAGKNLDSTDPDVAAEAYLEFARANDAEVVAAAKHLPPAKLRRLLDDPGTPGERLSLFAYMLGACGSAADAKLLSHWLAEPGDRFRAATGGLYAGLIMLDPAGGWKALVATLGDPSRQYLQRYAALSAVRFHYNADPGAHRAAVLSALRLVLPQGDIADLVVEDLRKWNLWDLTPDVLALYGRKSHDAPLSRRAIVRYALCCPLPEAKAFADRVRAADAELVKDVEESLQYERGTPKP